jgi:hypothetical protein
LLGGIEQEEDFYRRARLIDWDRLKPGMCSPTFLDIGVTTTGAAVTTEHGLPPYAKATAALQKEYWITNRFPKRIADI